MPWTVAGCLVLFLAVILTIDMNGNMVLDPDGPFPDVLHPAPTLLMLLSLTAGALIALTHVIRYAPRRRLWLCIFLFFVVLTIAAVLPAL